MRTRRIYDTERHAHFITFSCYKRRRLLDVDRSKRIVLGMLNSQLARQEGGLARLSCLLLMPPNDAKSPRSRFGLVCRTGVARLAHLAAAEKTPDRPRGSHPLKLRLKTSRHGQSGTRIDT